MSVFKNPASEFVFIRTYSRWLEDQGRRETWEETVDRYIQFIEKERGSKIPPKVIKKIRKRMLELSVMPSMRALWAAGPAASKQNLTMYNCSFQVVDSVDAFHECLYILMCGTGYGYRVLESDVEKLPVIPQINVHQHVEHVVEDSKEGWAFSVKVLMEALYSGHDVVFDYSKIRAQGARLKTMGGRASGPGPLMVLHSYIRETMIAAQGRKLRAIEASDIMNQIAEVVVVGGVRRSSQICLSDLASEEMRTAKVWPFPLRRAMANHSAVYNTKPSATDFLKEWSNLASSGTGERGIFNLAGARLTAPQRRDSAQIAGTNPCITGDTLIAVADGRNAVPIKDLVGTVYPVYTIKGGKVVIGKSIKTWKTRENAEIYKLTLDDGSVLRATPDHLIMLRNGKYKALKDLEVGDSLMPFGRESAGVAFIEFLGHEDVYDMTVEDTHNFGVVLSSQEGRASGSFGIFVHNCGEISLRSEELCNLSEVVIRAEDDLDELLDKVETATWLGAIQATFTHFPYLSKKWQENCDEERLLGVSLTGQMDNPEILTESALKALKKKAQKVAKHASEILGINMPAAITCVKPSGCRPWNALTTTNKGILTLEEIFADHEIGKKWSNVSNERNLFVQQDGKPCRITKTFHNGLAPTIEIKMQYGLSVESTPNHKWFVKERRCKQKRDGTRHEPVGQWVRADRLQEGDVLEVQLGTYENSIHAKLRPLNSLAIKMRGDVQDITQPEQMDEDLAWLLGYLWGDGAMSPSKFRIRFIDERKANLQKASRIINEKFGLNSKIHKASEHRNAFTLEIASKVLWHWLIKNGVFKYDADKLELIPECVRSSAWTDIVAFIAGLIDSDGWVGQRQEGTGATACITTADARFAKHLQDVSWAVGIGIGRSLNNRGKNLQANKAMYLMTIGKHVKPAAVKVLVKNSNKMTEAEKSTKFKQWQFLNGEKCLKAGEILSFAAGKLTETYDIEVEGDHWYMAGAVKSHNTVSQLVDSASGIHTRFSPYYIRRYRIASTDPLLKMLRDQGVPLSPENGQRESDWTKAEKGSKDLCPIFVEGEKWSEDKVNTWVVSFPVKSPDGAITKDQMTAIEQLEWYKKIQTNWCEHNASCTIYVKEDEWFEVGAWVYENWSLCNGLSFLPSSDHKYEQAPYEEITKEQYEKMAAKMPVIDYSQLAKYEAEDSREESGAKALACSGDKCELV